ncbi:TPA: hypothetical protein ACXGIH_004292 [Klebsiella pneumoniae]
MTKSTITRERLEWLSQISCRDDIEDIGGDEIRELASMALAAMDSEPVAWTWHYREQWHVTNDERRAEFVARDGDVAVLPLYRHAQPAPVVPDFKKLARELVDNLVDCGGLDEGVKEKYLEWAEKTCRAATLQATPVCTCPSGDGSLRWPCPVHAGSSPVIPDGYVLVPMRLTAENGAKEALSGEFSETKFVNCPECFGDDECETCDGSGKIEITVPVTWTTIKAIWVKGVEHFAATAQEND